MKNFLCVVLLLTCKTLFANTPGKNEDIDVQHYNFELELNDSTDIISGRATVTVLFKKAVSSFELDLYTKDQKGFGMEIVSITSNQDPISFTHLKNKLKLILTIVSTVNRTAKFVIVYKGIPQDGLIIAKNKYGDRTFFGDNWPDRARQWLPVVDHPSDKAPVDFIITAPPHYDVVANGIKVEESFIKRKQKLTHWREETPLATKVMVIGVARFAVQRAGSVQGMEVTSWVYPQNRLDGFSAYSPAPQILDFYINHIGPYSYQKLANVQSKTKYGGLENANTIFYFENSISSPTLRDLIAHEVAHQWFGNSATEIDWNHVWLSEGFATYLTILYNEFTFGRDRMKADLRKDRQEIIAFTAQTKLPVVFSTLPADLLEILNVNSYQKGGWVLHMLRNEVGDSAFWAGLQHYYIRFKNSNVSTSDFRQVMEEASGKNLTAFFNQWLYQVGHPVLTGSWVYQEAAQAVELTLTQTTQTPFQFPLEIGIYYENEEVPVIEKIFTDKISGKFNLKTTRKPAKIALDPNVNLLFEGKLKN
jgi:aminopeptidase N